MRLGTVPGTGGHPLFVPVFFLAAILNTLPLMLATPAVTRIELAALGVPHLAFIAWLAAADRAMRAQRALELTRFRSLLREGDQNQ